MYKNVHSGTHGCLLVMGLEREESRTDMKRYIKMAKKMHLNVFPDALPRSERLVHVLDRWLNEVLSCKTLAAVS